MSARNGREYGPLRRQLEAARREIGSSSFDDLTVLEKKRDPYRLDAPAWHRCAQWFAEQVERFLRPGQTIHLRGMHYLVLSAGDVRKPNGAIYINTDADWEWLADEAAKAARWLGYVSFDRIVDERNAEPVVADPPISTTPGWFLSRGISGEIPLIDQALPSYFISGFNAFQRYRLIFVGEKVSLEAELGPVAGEVGAELVLPTGTLSDTLTYGIAKRADEDGRPAVVLYFSDFDPAGWAMPAGLGRKLQALRDLCFPDLCIELHAVALNLDQVERFSLPSTPLKAGEVRADEWRKAWGREQTEIDALIALHPGEVARLARAACRPFWDETLRWRLRDAEVAYQQLADERLQAHPDYAAACQDIREALDEAETAVSTLAEAQETARDALSDMTLPDLEVPEAEVGGLAPLPLFSTDDDWIEATQRLIAHKRFRNGGSPPS
jgi:hypothetical protein